MLQERTPLHRLPRFFRAALALGVCGLVPTSAQTALPASMPLSQTSSYLALGQNYYQQGLMEQAYVAFRAASDSDPHSADALLGLGRSELRLRLYAPALETLNKLLQLAPQNLSAAIALAQGYTEQFANSPDRDSVKGNLGQALVVLQGAEKVARGQPAGQQATALAKVWNQRSVVYRLQGNFTEATVALQRADHLDPMNSVILYNLGDLYAATGKLSNALDSLRQAIQSAPQDALSRAFYATLLAQTGDFAAARSQAAQAASLAPQSAYATGQYGVVAYLAGDQATARAQLQAALKLDALRYPAFYYYLGRLELDGGALAAARSDLTKAVALASNKAEYLYYLGLSYERSAPGVPADTGKARTNYEQALRLNPANVQAQTALARIKSSNK